MNRFGQDGIDTPEDKIYCCTMIEQQRQPVCDFCLRLCSATVRCLSKMDAQ